MQSSIKGNVCYLSYTRVEFSQRESLWHWLIALPPSTGVFKQVWKTLANFILVRSPLAWTVALSLQLLVDPQPKRFQSCQEEATSLELVFNLHCLAGIKELRWVELFGPGFVLKGHSLFFTAGNFSTFVNLFNGLSALFGCLRVWLQGIYI